MAGNCCNSGCASAVARGRYRRILWIALLINLAMFAVEIGAGVRAGSVSLLADSLDFFGDAANYGVSLFVLGLGVMARARASLAKALTMGLFGVFILVIAVGNFVDGSVPQASTMGVVGVIALLANIVVAAMLYAYREGDSNMRSVWLCSRNDALGNLAVMLAALGVFGTGSGWPDLIVATIMALLSISAAVQITRHATAELRAERVVSGDPERQA
ncbi:cation transporter [Stutzerimonas stutzeri]|uniref:Cobalt transporter n=1 Tax=Stutzerimonas stutzeri KOS6 TaxID=1218352 RepID=A0A061JNW4_STUST|nr:cation diffusion facilitator family transporter [Stutzerimonas stutzeri]EWC41386.1 cobalt transporter [Stutzerimonas stutzeri KOS6]